MCKAMLELVGRLKGTETKAMQSLSQAIVFRMLSFFTEVAAVDYNELMLQLRTAWLTTYIKLPIALGIISCGKISNYRNMVGISGRCLRRRWLPVKRNATAIASSTGPVFISDPQLAH